MLTFRPLADLPPVFHQFNRVQALTTPAGAWPRLNGQKTVKGQAARVLGFIRLWTFGDFCYVTSGVAACYACCSTWSHDKKEVLPCPMR